ncbi:MAG: hypothetical protein ABFD89_23620 [Bryobacteraceae bacterium]
MIDQESAPQSTPDPLAITLDEYTAIMDEIEEQPKWRHTADKEMDYADGNQLSGELLRKMQELGFPPAIEDLIGPALLSIQGYESATRTDWRVTANGGSGGQDIADAINYQLNTAERESHADQACSNAFRPQIGVGLGWIEVSRNSDAFASPYRCTAIHRNEIHWDWHARESDLSDARWLRRQRWLRAERIKTVFPEHKELIELCGENGPSWWADNSIALDGGTSTDLNNAWNDARAWTVQEDRWYNRTNKELCLAELWYRRWEPVTLIETSDGRVVEYDENNDAHNLAVAAGMARVSRSIVPRVRRSYWLGPHRLFDGPSPYSHRDFPYVPFWGFREDSTGVPYGYVRGMIYPQDSLNSGTSKLRWGMSVARTERTKGAVSMTDAQLRRQVARPDADIVLDAQHMAQPGARFEIKRDYQLTDQHYQMLAENRAAIERVSSVTSGFIGRQGTARSGIQEQTQVEQTNQSLGRMMDNFRAGREMVGKLLMAMIIEDMGDQPQTVVIEGDAIREDRTVVINQPEVDPDTGEPYLSNDLQRTCLKVALEDVPSSASYRGQQLNAMSEAVKSLPAQYQAAVLPFMVSLMDVPFKKDVVEAIRAASAQEDPAAVEQRIKQSVQDALSKAGHELKARELDLKESKTNAEIKLIVAQAVQVGVQAAFSAMQGGAQVAQMPTIAPIADAIMQGAGYQRPDPAGDDPNFPTPEAGSLPVGVTPVHQNTSPEFPPVPAQGARGMTGIETARTSDNLPEAKQA